MPDQPFNPFEPLPSPGLVTLDLTPASDLTDTSDQEAEPFAPAAPAIVPPSSLGSQPEPIAGTSTTVLRPRGDPRTNRFTKRILDNPQDYQVGWWDRATANARDAFARGTLTGSGLLSAARSVLDDPNQTPAMKQMAAIHLQEAAL